MFHNPFFADEKPDYLHISTKIVPALLAAGVTQAQIDEMLVDNPRRFFARAGLRRGAAVEGVRTWSVGTDGGVVTADVPGAAALPERPHAGVDEPSAPARSGIRCASCRSPRGRCSKPRSPVPGESDLGEELLANVGVPESQVLAGVRLRRMPARAGRASSRPTGVRPWRCDSADDVRARRARSRGGADRGRVRARQCAPASGSRLVASWSRRFPRQPRLRGSRPARGPRHGLGSRARQRATHHEAPRRHPWRRSGSTPGTISTDGALRLAAELRAETGRDGRCCSARPAEPCSAPTTASLQPRSSSRRHAASARDPAVSLQPGPS